MFEFGFGDELKDIVSGFKGVVTARAEYANGCVHYLLDPRKLTADGKAVEADWFDSRQLKQTKAKRINVTIESLPREGPQRGGRPTIAHP